jgi:hypothetical protein
MTPQERQLVDDLFDRLARLETAPRDPDAEQAIAEGLRRAPNAVYALVQTALVQDEALRRADARIRELSGASEAAPSGGFLDSMRAALTGHSATSVPSVRSAPANEPDPRWNGGGAYSGANTAGGQYGTAPGAMAPQSQGGGSFLGTAAASAAGMIGGALLLNSISSMFGHHGGSAFADAPFGGAASPWDNSTSSASGSDLARDAGLNDIGNAGAGTDPGGAGLFGGGDDLDTTDVAGLGDDFGGDGGGGDGGGGDSA